MAILDIGVGGGRTTPYLSQKASRYVGVDYSEEMVRTCRNKFPGLEFMVADASDLSAFPDASFDAIVIAFNGLDYLFPNEKRRQCLRECGRVLRADGVLVFSSHNPRSIFVRPAWDRERLRAFAGTIVSETERFLCNRAVGVDGGQVDTLVFARDRRIGAADRPAVPEVSLLAGRRLLVRSRPRWLDDPLLDARPGRAKNWGNSIFS